MSLGQYPHAAPTSQNHVWQDNPLAEALKNAGAFEHMLLAWHTY